jgi:hypothetical protein
MIGNIYSYIDRGVGGWQQRPVFKANIVRSVNLRKVKPGLAVEDLRKLTGFFLSAEGVFQLDPSYEYTTAEPCVEHIEVFKILRKMHQTGLLYPEGEEYMYLAAMNSRVCRLTALGMYYWQLIKEGRL